MSGASSLTPGSRRVEAVRSGAGSEASPALPGAARAFLSTIFLLARSAQPNKVFGGLPEAVAWLAPLASSGDVAWSRKDLVAAAEAVTGRAPSPAG